MKKYHSRKMRLEKLSKMHVLEIYEVLKYFIKSYKTSKLSKKQLKSEYNDFYNEAIKRKCFEFPAFEELTR